MAATKLTPNMVKSLTNLAKAGTVIATNGTMAMNAKGCTAPAMDALKRRGLIELIWTDQPRNRYEGDRENHRSYKLTDAGEAELDRLGVTWTEQEADAPVRIGVDLNTGGETTQVQTTRNLVLEALLSYGMDPAKAVGLVSDAREEAWSDGYDNGFQNGKKFYQN